jgi:hypothetical protein
MVVALPATQQPEHGTREYSIGLRTREYEIFRLRLSRSIGPGLRAASTS